MATNQSNPSNAKRNGFLLFVLGCIIAVSGAAKLHETERVLRIRQSAEKATMKKVAVVVKQIAYGSAGKKASKKKAQAEKTSGKKVLTTLDVVSSLYRQGREMAHPRKRLLAQAKTLLQVSYIKLVHLSVAKLKIRQPRAVGAELKAKLLNALARKLNPVPSTKQARKKKQKIERALVSAMASQLLHGKASPAKTKGVKKAPKVVRDVLALLIDQAVRHLTPYVMWEVLLEVSAHKIEAVAKQKAGPLARALAKEIQQPIAVVDARRRLRRWLSDLVGLVGKELKLKSVERSFRADAALMTLLADRIQPKLSATQAAVVCGQMKVIFSRQIAASFARPLAMKVGERLQFQLTQVSAAGPKAARKRPTPARPAARRAAQPAPRRPAARPVVARAPQPARVRPAATSKPAAPTPVKAAKRPAAVRPPTSRPAVAAARTPAPRPAARARAAAPPKRPAAPASRRVAPARRPAMQRIPPALRALAGVQTAPPPQRDPLIAFAAQVTSMPPIYPQQVAFLKSTKRIGGWPSSLPIFLVGALLALIGLLLWRKAIRVEVQARLANQKDDDTNPFTLLKTVQEPLELLKKDITGLDAEGVCDRVDAILSNYILPFAEVRQGVIEQLGMKDGAEILVTVAFGERMLNRVWSAASDGHLPEALAVFPDAIDALDEAHTLAQKSLSAS